MNQTLKVLLVAVFLAMTIVAFRSEAASQMPLAVRGGKNIAVEIDYGKVRPTRTVETVSSRGESVLDILQSVAKVETEPVAGHIFVVSIDEVEGKRGERAWYYTLDGQKAKKLAHLQSPAGIQRIVWSYQEDVCSPTVDPKS